MSDLKTTLLSILCIPLLLLEGVVVAAFSVSLLIIFFFVKLVVEWHSHKTLQISTGSEALFSNITGSKDHAINFCFLFDGTVDDQFLKNIKRWILTAKDKNGFLMATNLQTLTKKKFGYMFKKKDPNFNIDDHVFLSPKLIKSKLDIKNLISEDNKINWDKNKPQWLLRFYKIAGSSEINLDEWKQTLGLLTISHHLTDGVSMSLWFGEMPKFSPHLNAVDSRESHFKIIKNFPKAIYNTFFYCPLECCKIIFKPDRSCFTSKKISTEIFFSMLEAIEMDRIKAVAQYTNTQTFNIYVSCFVAAMCKYYKTLGNKSIGDVFTFFPACYRKENDPLILINKIFFMPIWFPGGPMEPLERLREITRRIDDLKNSPLPYIYLLAFEIMSRFPVDLFKWLQFRFFKSELSFSVVPDMKIDGRLINGSNMIENFGGVNQYTPGGMLFVMHLKNKACVSFCANHNILKTQKDSDTFLEYFEEEFEKLEEIVKETKKYN